MLVKRRGHNSGLDERGSCVGNVCSLKGFYLVFKLHFKPIVYFVISIAKLNPFLGR